MDTIAGLGRERPIETAAHLLPLRRARMSVSPFTFYRGTANLMAHDLASQTVSGVHVVLCGDAHLSNFGLYAPPERRLVFDLNDFDEAAPGPWEWDLKRLVTSVVLGGSDIGLRNKDIRTAAMRCATAYREAIHVLAGMDALARFYVHADASALHHSVSRTSREAFGEIAGKARLRTSRQVIEKMMVIEPDGRVRFRTSRRSSSVSSRRKRDSSRCCSSGIAPRYERMSRCCCRATP